MRWLRMSLKASAAVALAGLLGLNLRTQFRTQQKLDALTAALAEKLPAAPTPAPPTPPAAAPEPGSVPRELTRVNRPPYVIETPDVLTIEVVRKDPKTGGTDRLPEHPISGQFQVRPDGTVGLGFWGSVEVNGLTLDQAAAAIRKQLAKSNEKVSSESLAVSVDVLAYNSKVYYVITDGADTGEQVTRLPLTGNETVLDAIANVGGLPNVASKRNIWVARSTPHAGRPWQTLPVDWTAITQSGVTTTNYQLFPGDRVYVKRAAD